MQKVIQHTEKTAIPFLDITKQDNQLQTEIAARFQTIINTSQFVLGPYVDEFEKKFSNVTGTNHCIAVNSGTSAIHLALLATGIKPGDEVITVPMTFVGTVWPILYAGAIPVFVDIDPTTYTIDVNQVLEKITKKTKAVIPVHLYGNPANLSSLIDVCERLGVSLIEDAAQAHGAVYKSQPVGSFGACGCFSFYPGKNLGAYGEGGAVVTNDATLAQRIRSQTKY